MLKQYKKHLLGYLVLGIWLMMPMTVVAQVNDNEVYETLYAQIEDLQSRIIALQNQISALYPTTSTIDDTKSARLTEFRRILENKNDEERTKPVATADSAGGSAVSSDCVSNGRVHSVGTELRQIESSGATISVDNGRVLCEEKGWQPYLCINSRSVFCHLDIKEPTERWCELGGTQIPDTMSATVFSNDLSSITSRTSNKVLCADGELQVTTDVR